MCGKRNSILFVTLIFFFGSTVSCVANEPELLKEVSITRLEGSALPPVGQDGFAVSNGWNHAIELYEVEPDGVGVLEEYLIDGKWVNDGARFCGTGIKKVRIPINGEYRFFMSERRHRCQWRIRLGFEGIGIPGYFQAQTKVFPSDILQNKLRNPNVGTEILKQALVALANVQKEGVSLDTETLAWIMLAFQTHGPLLKKQDPILESMWQLLYCRAKSWDSFQKTEGLELPLFITVAAARLRRTNRSHELRIFVEKCVETLLLDHRIRGMDEHQMSVQDLTWLCLAMKSLKNAESLGVLAVEFPGLCVTIADVEFWKRYQCSANGAIQCCYAMNEFGNMEKEDALLSFHAVQNMKPFQWRDGEDKMMNGYLLSSCKYIRGMRKDSFASEVRLLSDWRECSIMALADALENMSKGTSSRNLALTLLQVPPL